jgi:hypothetical protein
MLISLSFGGSLLDRWSVVVWSISWVVGRFE